MFESDTVAITFGPAGLAVVTIANPPVNVCTRDVRRDLCMAIEHLYAQTSVDVVVITGDGRNFMAGADIREFDDYGALPSMPDVVNAVEKSPKVTIAAIDGLALGAGAEIALACDYRMVSDRAAIGFPEIKLGLIPGSGGTQRLPRLVGVATAITMITRGNPIEAPDALACGLVDAVVGENVIDEACLFAQQRPVLSKRRLSQQLVRDSFPEEIDAAVATARKSAKGLPAIEKAISAVLKTAGGSFDDGLKQERSSFLELMNSAEAKALRYIFLAERATSAPTSKVGSGKLSSVGIFGLGLMGSRIAVALLCSGFKVVGVEIDAEGCDRGARNVRDLLMRQETENRLLQTSAVAVLDRFHTTTDENALRECDLVIEAVVEDFAIKRDILSRIERAVSEHAIIATNTSYLDIDKLAEGISNPNRIAGLHFFNPAHIMKLVEIVRTDASDAPTIATLQSLVKRLGKVSVIASVGEGFIGNRLLQAYRQECEFLLLQGATPMQIDDAMTGFGMALGPFATSDMSGLDIAWRMRQRLSAERGHPPFYIGIADRLCEMGRLGLKSGAGWFDYVEGRRIEATTTLSLVEQEAKEKGMVRRLIDDSVIQRTVLASILLEACHILEEGVAIRPSDIDVVLVNGYGFPRRMGGIMHHAGIVDLFHDREGMAGTFAVRVLRKDVSILDKYLLGRAVRSTPFSPSSIAEKV